MLWEEIGLAEQDAEGRLHGEGLVLKLMPKKVQFLFSNSILQAK